MRLSSASDTAEKGDRRRKGHSKQSAPRPDTRIRAIYDKLMANPGVPVNLYDLFPSERHLSTKQVAPLLDQLRDFYGLDVRIWKYGNKWSGARAQHVLCGVWNGTDYTDFTHRL